MKTLLVIAALLWAGSASATTATELAVADAVRAQLPDGLGLVSIDLPATAPSSGDVVVKWRGTPKAGKVSLQVTVGGRPFWARVQLAGVASRPAPVAAPKRAAAMIEETSPAPGSNPSSPPISRGAPVKVVVRRGNVEISTDAVLERAARVGEPAIARLTTGARLVHGRLVAADLFVVGDSQ